MKPTIYLTALAIMLTAGIAEARGPRGKNSERHRQRLLERFGDEGIDANEDGTLTREEIAAFMAENDMPMPRHHRRHRGPAGRERHGNPLARTLMHLDKLASETAPERFSLDRFPDADADGDGVLSDEEWQTFAAEKRSEVLARLLDRLPGADANADGVIDATELDALRQMVDQRRREDVLLRHPDADTDGNGTLSDEELGAFEAERRTERRTRLLDRHPGADVDGDGVLSDEEVDAFRQAHPRRDRPGKFRGRGHRGQRSRVAPTIPA